MIAEKAMRTVTVVEFEIYTDGDFYFNKSFLLNYTSRYFDQEFYEYTKIDDYSYSARRVFDRSEEAVEFLNTIKDNCGRQGEKNYIVDEVVIPLIDDVLQDYWKHGRGYDWCDGNQTIEISITDVETDVKKIKSIQYE